MKLVGIISIVFITFNVSASNVKSTLNNKALTIQDSSNYSFIVSGHFYGNRFNKTGYPVNTLLGNLDWINSSDASMLVCLGDLFMDVKNDIPNYKKSLFSKLQIPLFNAVGNHDVSGDVYNSNFGKTFYSFNVNNDIHIIIDTELNDGSIKNEQLEFLNQILNNLNAKTKNVFIYGHRTLWARSYPKLDGLFESNTQSTFGNNFEEDVLPILKKMQSKVQVYWFSGSLGDAPSSFFNYQSDEGIYYIATAIRGLKRDAVLTVNVNNSVVNFSVKSFTNENLLKFSDYNVDYWNKNMGKKEAFNFRLLPLLIKQTVLSYGFWFGGIAGILLLLIGKKVFKSKKQA